MDKHMKPVRARFILAIALLSAIATLPACGTTTPAGSSPVFLIIDALEGASGAEPDAWTGVLSSDVLTCVENCTAADPDDRQQVRFSDNGRIRVRLGLTDPGTPTTPTVPTTANYVTITRYRLVYRGPDGTQIIPPFEGGLTGTITSNSAPTDLVFVLVQAQRKAQSPLVDLVSGGSLNTVVEVTIFGKDQTGREIQATGTMSVLFANWADPD
jgi:hypothetical protein